MERENDSFFSIKENSPVAFYSLYLLAGCLLGSVFIIKLSVLFLVITTYFLLLIFHYHFFTDYKRKIWIPVYKVPFFLLGLFGITLQSTKPNYENMLMNMEEIEVRVPVLEKPVKKGNFISLNAYLNNSTKILRIKTKDECLLKELKIGDTLNIEASFQNISTDKFGNFTLVIPKQNIKIIKCDKPRLLISFLKFRDSIAKKAESKMKNAKNLGIFNALILGNKSGITKDINNDFSKAGIMHMLAISGMHTGYIYAILLVVLSFLGQSKVSIYIKSIVIILFIWFYAILSGFADSVIRSAFMITIHQFAYIIERGKVSLNTIGISAMIMLVLNPSAIFNLGFQLSFMATLSIILIFPLFNNILNVKNRVLKYIWQVTTMSISGQTGTVVITIFSFGKFPLYFMLGNILAAPIVALTMIFSFAAISLLPFVYLSDLCFKCSEMFISILNFIAKSIASLPFSSINY